MQSGELNFLVAKLQDLQKCDKQSPHRRFVNLFGFARYKGITSCRACRTNWPSPPKCIRLCSETIGGQDSNLRSVRRRLLVRYQRKSYYIPLRTYVDLGLTLSENSDISTFGVFRNVIQEIARRLSYESTSKTSFRHAPPQKIRRACQ